MPSYRKLPSGRWQATVRLPDGTRATQTDPLKRVVVEWAEQTAADARRGLWRDPRVERTTITAWYARWVKMRSVEVETARADEGSWRLHIEPTFGKVALQDLTRLQVREWVAERQRAGVGPAAIRRALNHFKACIEGAVDAEIVKYNVARKVEPPEQHEQLPDWYTGARSNASPKPCATSGASPTPS